MRNTSSNIHKMIPSIFQKETVLNLKIKLSQSIAITESYYKTKTNGKALHPHKRAINRISYWNWQNLIEHAGVLCLFRTIGPRPIGLTEPMYRTKSDQANCMVLQIVIAASVPFACQLGAAPQAANHQQREKRKAQDTRHDWYDNRFRSNCGGAI